MKITKTKEQSAIERTNREKANLFCTICPGCGARKTKLGFPFGGFVKTGYDFFYGNWRIDCYYCDHCGTEWESEKYKW